MYETQPNPVQTPHLISNMAFKYAIFSSNLKYCSWLCSEGLLSWLHLASLLLCNGIVPAVRLCFTVSVVFFCLLSNPNSTTKPEISMVLRWGCGCLYPSLVQCQQLDLNQTISTNLKCVLLNSVLYSASVLKVFRIFDWNRFKQTCQKAMNVLLSDPLISGSKQLRDDP